MLKMLQIKLWPIIVHRDAVPEKQLCEITTRHPKEEIQTISRAIYLSVASPVTYDGQNFAQSPAP